MACHLIIKFYVASSHLMQWGRSALFGASIRGHVEVAKVLLAKGAATDLTDVVSLLCVHIEHACDAEWCV